MVERRVSGQNNETWGYETHFREYLLLLARKGNSALESINNFPSRIELNNVWHDTMEKMRKESEDGHERYALIGFREDIRNLVLPTVFGYGENGNESNGYRANIPPEVQKKEIEKAKKKAGIKGLVGDIHTHPMAPPETLSLLYEILGEYRSFYGGAGFSPADLYMFIGNGITPLPMRVLVRGEDVMLAFKTRQTKTLPYPMKWEDFEKHWYGKKNEYDRYNYNLLINKAIARSHSLVLYKGKVGKPILRIYP